jgi:hypothetical protein
MNRRWWLRYMMHFDLLFPALAVALFVVASLLRLVLPHD